MGDIIFVPQEDFRYENGENPQAGYIEAIYNCDFEEVAVYMFNITAGSYFYDISSTSGVIVQSGSVICGSNNSWLANISFVPGGDNLFTIEVHSASSYYVATFNTDCLPSPGHSATYNCALGLQVNNFSGSSIFLKSGVFGTPIEIPYPFAAPVYIADYTDPLLSFDGGDYFSVFVECATNNYRLYADCYEGISFLWADIFVLYKGLEYTFEVIDTNTNTAISTVTMTGPNNYFAGQGYGFTEGLINGTPPIIPGTPYILKITYDTLANRVYTLGNAGVYPQLISSPISGLSCANPCNIFYQNFKYSLKDEGTRCTTTGAELRVEVSSPYVMTSYKVFFHYNDGIGPLRLLAVKDYTVSPVSDEIWLKFDFFDFLCPYGYKNIVMNAMVQVTDGMTSCKFNIPFGFQLFNAQFFEECVPIGNPPCSQEPPQF